MLLLIAFGVSLLLTLIVILIHYQTLEIISSYLPRLNLPHRLWIIVVILGVYVGHFIEICVFAFAYFFLDQGFGFGGFTDPFEKSALDYLYFSAASYTTLGLSSFQPTGNIKIVTALEALTGFLMITWSASFGYKAIKEEGFWEDVDEVEKVR
ncbi:MAG TPA: ion channel [Anaerolineae bacterium]|nr:ion channel [Anaerolineae bacterium]